MSNDQHVNGTDIGISVVRVTPIDERIMRLRPKHSLRCVKLKGRCTPNSNLYWTSVPVMMDSLSWAALMLSLPLIGFITKYVLAPKALVPRTTTALYF